MKINCYVQHGVNMDLPKRRVILEIQTDDKTVKTFDGLNVNFNVSKQTNSVTPSGRIVVANLTMEDVVNITTISGTYTDVKKRKKVRLYAGYDDDIGMIFEGDITSAAPITEPPDVWLQIEATNGFFDNNRVVSKTIKEKTNVKNLAEQVAGWLKVPLQWMSKASKTVNMFSASGSAGQFIRKLNDIGDILAFKDEDGLVVLDLKNPKRGTTSEVSKNTGMIGIPKADNNGIRVDVLLNPHLKLGQTINLKSELIPSLNGPYWIYGLTHSGSLRDNEYVTTMLCRKQ